MPYRIQIVPSALRQMSHFDGRLRDRLGEAIDGLAQDPRPRGAVKLEGKANRWRVRVGDYRVIYDIVEGILLVMIIRIAHRREAYRGM